MNKQIMKKSPPIRILIADDHYLVRMGLIAMINTEPDMQIVAEATDGAQAVALFKKSTPDVALMDLRMPIKSGIEATVEIRKQNNVARILMLTALDGDEDIHTGIGSWSRGLCVEKLHGRKTDSGYSRRGGWTVLDSGRSSQASCFTAHV